MRLSEGSFCYPVLSEESSDYRTPSFRAECSVTENGCSLRFDFTAISGRLILP